MADTVASLQVLIGADVTGAINGMNQVKNNATQLSDMLKSTGAALTAGVTVPVIGFMTAAIKEASDEQTALAQLNTVIKSTGGAAGVSADMATKLADKLSLTTRYSKDQTLAAENMMLTFTNINKGIFPDTIALAQDLSTAMNQDLKSSVVQLGKALNDPAAGMSALKRVGVEFTQQQIDQAKAMEAAGNLAGAQAIVLKELQKEFGGSAQAAGGTFAGKLDILNHRFQEFLGTVGNLLLPILDGALGKLSDFVGWLEKLPQPVLQAGLAFLAFAATLGPILAIVGNLKTVLGGLAPFIAPLLIIVGLIGAYESNFAGFRDWVNDLGDKLRALGPAGEIAAVGLTLLIVPLGKLVLGFVISGLSTAISAVATAFGVLLTTIFPIIAPLILVGALVAAYTTNFLGFRDAIDNLGKSLRQLKKDLESVTVAKIDLGSTNSVGGGGVGGANANAAVLAWATGKTIGVIGNPGATVSPGRASGGPVSSGQSYVVGDGGEPELFTPGANGYITPMSRLGGGSGNGMIHIVLQADGFTQHIYARVASAIAAGVG